MQLCHNIQNRYKTRINKLLSPTKAETDLGPATFKKEHFAIIANGCKPLAIITKSSILDVTSVLDLPLQR